MSRFIHFTLLLLYTTCNVWYWSIKRIRKHYASKLFNVFNKNIKHVTQIRKQIQLNRLDFTARLWIKTFILFPCDFKLRWILQNGEKCQSYVTLNDIKCCFPSRRKNILLKKRMEADWQTFHKTWNKSYKCLLKEQSWHQVLKGK